jgi:hypothetical protein
MARSFMGASGSRGHYRVFPSGKQLVLPIDMAHLHAGNTRRANEPSSTPSIGESRAATIPARPAQAFPGAPDTIERATVALEACDAPKPVPVWPLPSPGQSDELTHLRLAENVSSAFASMQSNDAVDGVQFGWLD